MCETETENVILFSVCVIYTTYWSMKRLEYDDPKGTQKDQVTPLLAQPSKGNMMYTWRM